MKRRKLGKLDVSAIGLGAPIYGDLTERDVAVTLHAAIERGVDFVDTADRYAAGRHEELLGRALKGRRDKVVLASKFGNIPARGGMPASANGRPDYVIQACEASLRRLGVETIDLYYIHRIDPAVPIEDTVGAMARLVEQGKVRHLGICEAAPGTIRRAHATHPLAALQTEYSLWSREPEDELLDTCAALGIGFVPYSPLGRGFLAGAITEEQELGDDDLRRTLPRFTAAHIARNLALVAELKRLAAANGCSAAQLALAWLLSRRDFIVPIPGTKQLRWLEENIAAADLAPPAATLAALSRLFAREAVSGPRYGDDQMRRVGL